MKFCRLLPLLAALIFASCATWDFSGHHGDYTKLRVTNHRGGVMSEWVARGKIKRTEAGYRITAVERRSAAPYAQLSKYPEGWRTTVTGPHIERWRCGQPYWLYEWESE
ncbi:MAG: hypothetical protein K8R23_08275 [Chthoniobacter sp.]|nr:hypothetical protein [Chthoniobacter sp.]